MLQRLEGRGFLEECRGSALDFDHLHCHLCALPSCPMHNSLWDSDPESAMSKDRFHQEHAQNKEATAVPEPAHTASKTTTPAATTYSNNNNRAYKG
jgi:hypothetical protein